MARNKRITVAFEFFDEMEILRRMKQRETRQGVSFIELSREIVPEIRRMRKKR